MRKCCCILFGLFIIAQLTGCKTEKIDYTYSVYAVVNDYEDNGDSGILTVNIINNQTAIDYMSEHPEYYSHENIYSEETDDISKVCVTTDIIRTYDISKDYIEDYEDAKKACNFDGIISIEIENGAVCDVKTTKQKMIEKPSFPTGIEYEIMTGTTSGITFNNIEGYISVYDYSEEISVYLEPLNKTDLDTMVFTLIEREPGMNYIYYTDLDSSDDCNELYINDGGSKNFFITYDVNAKEWSGWYIFGKLKFDGNGGIDAYIDGPQYTENTDEAYVTNMILGTSEGISQYLASDGSTISILKSPWDNESEYINRIKAIKEEPVIHYDYKNGVITGKK